MEQISILVHQNGEISCIFATPVIPDFAPGPTLFRSNKLLRPKERFRLLACYVLDPEYKRVLLPFALVFGMNINPVIVGRITKPLREPFWSDIYVIDLGINCRRYGVQKQ